MITDKDKWIMKERVRWARYFNVPIVDETPPNFPPLTLSAMRIICALGRATGQPQTSPAAQDVIVGALDAFYEAYWVQGRVITDKAVEADVLAKIIGAGGSLEAAKVLESSGGQGKQVLLENTDLAIAEGAFGLPWMVCENDKGEKEGFWGCDHLGCVLEFLGIEKPRAGSWKPML